MTVASINHVLVVDPKLRRVMHHQRQQGGAFLTRLACPDDDLVFTSPAFRVAIAAFFQGLDVPTAASG
jgi:hypothetical protein